MFVQRIKCSIYKRKPMISYELAIITGFTTSNTKEVTLKARGRAITTAVDVAEITRRRFMKEWSIGKITIGTEEIPREEDGTRNVSTILRTCSSS